MRYILIIAAAIVGILSPGIIRHRVRIEGPRYQNLSHLQTPIQQTGSHHNPTTLILPDPIIADGAGAEEVGTADGAGAGKLWSEKSEYPVRLMS